MWISKFEIKIKKKKKKNTKDPPKDPVYNVHCGGSGLNIIPEWGVFRFESGDTWAAEGFKSRGVGDTNRTQPHS